VNNALTQNQREYVLFHLDQVIDLSSDIRGRFVFDHNNDQKIHFFQNHHELNNLKILNHEGIPILFPGDSKKPIYTLEKGTLVFHHDLLRSAFYLLSGYQEYQSNEQDKLGRFPYDASLQYKLGVLHKPIVNYYFEWISEGLKAYCSYHKIPFRKRQLFESFGFFLTHDIDRIDKFTFQSTKNRLKKKKFKEFIYHASKWLNPFDHDNPYWSFDFLLNLNKKYGMKSTFFFLNQGVRHIDSYYRYSMKRVSELIKRLEKEGCEVGLHGTVKSADDSQIMRKNLNELNAVVKEAVIGNRQHRLIYTHPKTMILLNENGIKYDAGLGYAGHEGFRNAYCLPFRLYDFENDKMLDIWEIPLIVMEITLFDYRHLSYEEALVSLENILAEITRFHGIFTLIWHNSSCDEDAKPGICQFYDSVLKMVHDLRGESVRGKDILDKLDVQ
jgi:peptidoglycan/xylan/chitin deacetylase (PgdA/CDA1 family)